MAWTKGRIRSIGMAARPKQIGQLAEVQGQRLTRFGWQALD